MSELKQKETVEVALLVVAIAKFLRKELATDGLQVTDLVKLATSQEFLERFIDAISGLGAVPVELSTSNKLEGIDLAIFALTAAREVLADEQAA